MAKKTINNPDFFFQVGALGSKPVVDYSAIFNPALEKINKQLEVAQAKSDALINAMPAGVNISEVPKELQPQITTFLKDNKAKYVEAAKVVSQYPSSHPKYIEAIETMNTVQDRFESLKTNTQNIMLKRQASLDSRYNISQGATKTERIDHENWASGEIYNNMTLSEDGIFDYKSADGTTKSSRDYAIAFQSSSIGTDEMESFVKDVKTDARYGDKFDERRYRGKINNLLKTLGTKGVTDFIYGGYYEDDSGTTEYINKYIEDNYGVMQESNPEEFEQLHEGLKTQDLSKDFGDWLLGVLRDTHANTSEMAAGRGGQGGEKEYGAEIWGRWRDSDTVIEMADQISNPQNLTHIDGWDNIKYYPQKDGTFKSEKGEIVSQTWMFDNFRIPRELRVTVGESEPGSSVPRHLFMLPGTANINVDNV